MCFDVRLSHIIAVVSFMFLSVAHVRADDQIVATTDTNAVEIEEQAAIEKSIDSIDGADVSETVAAQQPDPISLATDHMVGVYYSYRADRVQRALQNSGLAQPEIDDVVDSVAQRYAECIVSSLQKANNRESAHVIKMLADGEKLNHVSQFVRSLDVPGASDPLEVFDVESRTCMQSLDASHGLD